MSPDISEQFFITCIESKSKISMVSSLHSLFQSMTLKQVSRWQVTQMSGHSVAEKHVHTAAKSFYSLKLYSKWGGWIRKPLTSPEWGRQMRNCVMQPPSRKAGECEMALEQLLTRLSIFPCSGRITEYPAKPQDILWLRLAYMAYMHKCAIIKTPVWSNSLTYSTKYTKLPHSSINLFSFLLQGLCACLCPQINFLSLLMVFLEIDSKIYISDPENGSGSTSTVQSTQMLNKFLDSR